MRNAIVFAAALLVGGTAEAAVLVHSYEFNGSTVTDGTGSLDGVLGGGATIAGGVLNLDGVDDYASLSGKALDLTQAYSVYLRYSATGQDKYITEMVSQGYSGQPGFYIGTINGEIRLTDYRAGGIGVGLPQNGRFHDLVFTTGAGSQVFLDGVLVWSSADNFTPNDNDGADTVFGNQFGNGYGENFRGQIDRARFFQGVATYYEAVANDVGAVPEPASWAMLMAGFGLVGFALRGRREVRIRYI